MQKTMSHRPIIIGVMGGADVSDRDCRAAYELGGLIAANGWVLLNGGRNCGIMEASAKGALEQGGITVGILPDSDPNNISEFIQIPIITAMGSARNSINVLSSNVVVACCGGAGTISEIALALKHGKPVILMNFSVAPLFEDYRQKGVLTSARTPAEVIVIIKRSIMNP
jgi:uncharacterized protein (TIGR00725 family)